ncbi:MAG: AAA family ATPase [Spirochaetota bacterium]
MSSSQTAWDPQVQERAIAAGEKIRRVEQEIQRYIVGHTTLVEQVLVCLLCRGHALLEGVPGLGKTFLIKTFGEVMDLTTTRIQFTPDLMPADIIGTNVLVRDEEGNQLIRFQKGPIFSQVLLADEINRATPKTQSALLEAMQEQNVTVAGQSYALVPPFIVLATQNPIEMEGTYPLPEAQLDRFFFKLKVEYPAHNDLLSIVDRTTSGVLPVLERILAAPEIVEVQDLIRAIPASRPVMDYAVRLVYATHPDRDDSIDEVKRFVRYGSSPRGAQSLILAAKVYALLDGRFTVSFDDIRRAALPSLRHRLILSFQGEAEGVDPDSIVERVIENTPEAGR